MEKGLGMFNHLMESKGGKLMNILPKICILRPILFNNEAYNSIRNEYIQAHQLSIIVSERVKP